MRTGPSLRPNANEILCLQNDLDVLADWCREKCMKLSIHKSFVVRFRRGPPQCLMLPEDAISDSDCVKYLGVYVDSKANFNRHVEIVSQKGLDKLWKLRYVQGMTRHIYFEFITLYVVA